MGERERQRHALERRQDRHAGAVRKAGKLLDQVAGRHLNVLRLRLATTLCRGRSGGKALEAEGSIPPLVVVELVEVVIAAGTGLHQTMDIEQGHGLATGVEHIRSVGE